MPPLIALGLCAFAVFICELALMRAVAQVTWPPFAFLALSAAMLGGGFAGTALAIRPTWATHPSAPAVGALVVAFGSPLALVVTLKAGLEPLHLSTDPAAAFTFVAVLLVIALPFVGLGVALSALLEQTPLRPQLPYGADLCGGALGAFLAVPLIDALGITATSGFAAIIAALAALMLQPKRRLSILLAIAVGALTIFVGRDLLPNPTADKKVGQMAASEVLKKLRANNRLLTADRADGRVDVIPASPAPRFLIDLGAAVTRAPRYPFNGPAPTDAASAAFLARETKGGRVLIIGSGAGFEVARALAYGAKEIDAVEVSSGVVELVRHDEVKTAQRVFADPRVKLHLDEARSFLMRSEKKWTHMVAVHTITNAALSAGAMRLAEDFLLTRESITSMLAHLEPTGVLYLTRPAAQMPLLVDVARAALLEVLPEGTLPEGTLPEALPERTKRAEIDQHLVVLAPDRKDPFFRGLLVFRGKTPTDLTLPTGVHRAPLPSPTGRPLPTDDRPFFHRGADEVEEEEDTARLRIEGPGLAEAALRWTGFLSTLAALLVLVIPLFARRRSSVPAPRLHLLAVAGLLGFGFMFAELALAQRLTLLLGRPLVAFAVVVGGMLLGAGGGALLLSKTRYSLRFALALAAVTTSLAFFVPSGVAAISALGWEAPWRLGLGVFIAVSVAAPLGLPFPALVERARALGASGSAPWLYAINAVTAVGAGALHATLAPVLGLGGTTLVAGACYGLGMLLTSFDRSDSA